MFYLNIAGLVLKISTEIVSKLNPFAGKPEAKFNNESRYTEIRQLLYKDNSTSEKGSQK